MLIYQFHKVYNCQAPHTDVCVAWVRADHLTKPATSSDLSWSCKPEAGSFEVAWLYSSFTYLQVDTELTRGLDDMTLLRPLLSMVNSSKTCCCSDIQEFASHSFQDPTVRCIFILQLCSKPSTEHTTCRHFITISEDGEAIEPSEIARCVLSTFQTATKNVHG